MICECNITSGHKRLDGVPAKLAADSVSQGGFPLGHQILKGALPPSKNGIKPFWGGQPPTGLRPVGVWAPSPGFLAGCRALIVIEHERRWNVNSAVCCREQARRGPTSRISIC